mgnify:CR=1 FL=1
MQVHESNSEIQGKMAVKEIKAQGMTPLVKTVSESNEIQSVTDSIVGKADALYIPLITCLLLTSQQL